MPPPPHSDWKQSGHVPLSSSRTALVGLDEEEVGGSGGGVAK